MFERPTTFVCWQGGNQIVFQIMRASGAVMILQQIMFGDLKYEGNLSHTDAGTERL